MYKKTPGTIHMGEYKSAQFIKNSVPLQRNWIVYLNLSSRKKTCKTNNYDQEHMMVSFLLWREEEERVTF